MSHMSVLWFSVNALWLSVDLLDHVSEEGLLRQITNGEKGCCSRPLMTRRHKGPQCDHRLRHNSNDKSSDDSDERRTKSWKWPCHYITITSSSSHAKLSLLFCWSLELSPQSCSAGQAKAASLLARLGGQARLY
jgi:hypothetical protein